MYHQQWFKIDTVTVIEQSILLSGFAVLRFNTFGMTFIIHPKTNRLYNLSGKVKEYKCITVFFL